jgi:hypothetical protein
MRNIPTKSALAAVLEKLSIVPSSALSIRLAEYWCGEKRHRGALRAYSRTLLRSAIRDVDPAVHPWKTSAVTASEGASPSKTCPQAVSDMKTTNPDVAGHS